MAKYIDRDKAFDAVDERIDELKGDKEFNIVKEICISGVKKHIASIPTANVIPIPEGATNGDMIKVMFPNIETEPFAMTVHASTKVTCNGVKGGISYDFWKEWWNAPYKGEVEE